MAKLTDITGVGDSLADDLRDEGFNSVDTVATADRSELTEVDGVGDSNADDLIESAQEVITTEHTDDDEDDGETREGVKPDYIEETPEDESDGGDEEPANLSETSESDESGSQSDSNEEYTFTLRVNEEEHIDYVTAALVHVKTERMSTNPEQSDVADDLLSEVRGLSDAGDVELTMTADEINTLHSALTQEEQRYQGRVDSVHGPVRDLREQIDDVREEHLF